MCEYELDVKEIRILMAENDIRTIAELSEISGVDRNILGEILNGKSQPSAPTMMKLAKTFKMSSEKAGRIFLQRNLRNT